MNRPTMTESVANYIKHREPQIDKPTALAAATQAIAEIISILDRAGEGEAANYLRDNRFK